MSSSVEELTEILDRVLASLDPWTDQTGQNVRPVASKVAESAPIVVLALPRLEAVAGTRRLIRFTVTDPCTRCGGNGMAGSGRRKCRRCKGAGTVAVERRLRLLVPPGVDDGTKLRVHGEGGVSSPGEAAGDLFVQIQVEP